MKHVGIILDGNRRWASEQGKKPWDGHQAGFEKARDLVEYWGLELGIEELTLYTFSVQNFQRDKLEVEFLFKIFKRMFTDFEKDKIKDKGIRVNFIGRLSLFSKDMQDMMHKLMDATKDNSDLIVNFAMGYGGREEIVDAVKSLIDSGDEITIDTLSSHMYLESEPELIIRTGGAMRTSNFLMWQSWYSEWFFLEKYWPAFEKEDLVKVIDEFKNRERRFGK